MLYPSSQLAEKRISVRSYNHLTLSEAEITQIQTILDTDNTGIFLNKLRFVLVNKLDFINEQLRLGTYGFISGAQHFIVGIMQKKANMGFFDFGYVLEKKILQFTAMNLGTCWMAGTVKRKDFSIAAGLKNDEIIPAISPIGIPAQRQGLKSLLIRTLAGSKNRKAANELFFEQNFEAAFQLQHNEKLQIPLEMVRLAPSSNNHQPWRLLIEPQVIHVFLHRKKNATEDEIDMPAIDIGIACAHLELGCNEMGLAGKWEKRPIKDNNKNMEYMISFAL